MNNNNIFPYRISRGRGYKTSELEGLQEGQTLYIGGKEMEACFV